MINEKIEARLNVWEFREKIFLMGVKHERKWTRRNLLEALPVWLRSGFRK